MPPSRSHSLPPTTEELIRSRAERSRAAERPRAAVRPRAPKPKFMTLEDMAAVVKEKERQARKAEQEYKKRALAAEKARLEYNSKLVDYEAVSVC